MTYYVKLDTDGWITGTPATEQAADNSLTAVDIPVTSIQYFLRYPTKYRVVNGELRAPANLPDLDIDSLKAIVDQQASQLSTAMDTINKQNDLIKASNATIQSLQATAGALGGQLAQSSVTISKLQTALGTVGGSVAQLEEQVKALTPATASSK
ncbi:hypothetical protein [Lentilactobacillus buchneri]|uniref:hypothetical protein n=1 Tax=Lentilactobacillus buchneri TaxID=1581 RepID=UPI0021A57B5C|nr:hypothetical protein [Lentilactobacillus buchneri]MCT2881907.1 hypothetical protein [Lentilactobacillus buchneri]